MHGASYGENSWIFGFLHGSLYYLELQSNKKESDIFCILYFAVRHSFNSEELKCISVSKTTAPLYRCNVTVCKSELSSHHRRISHIFN
jgi:hypothetical protein